MKEECKVLGPNLTDNKWFNGSLQGWWTPLKNTHNLVRVFTCFVLHLITLHIGHEKHQSSSHIYEEVAHKIWGHDFISKCAVGTTTVLLAQASIFFAK